MYDDGLLMVLGAIGKLSFEKYKGILSDALVKFGISEQQSLRPFELLTTLESLGHCTVDYTDRKVYMCPPGAVLLPALGLPKVALMGGRDPKEIQHLYKIAESNGERLRVIQLKQATYPPHLIPDSIILEATSIKILNQTLEKIRVAPFTLMPYSWAILQRAAGIDEIRSSLEYTKQAEPNWQQRTFNDKYLFFTERKSISAVKLITYTNPYSQQQVTWLWNGATAAEVDRNWGRYLMLNHSKNNVLIYSQREEKLSIPATVPLPKVYAKAAAMCSGMAPRREVIAKEVRFIDKGTPILSYDSVPLPIAELLARKLDQQLVYENVNGGIHVEHH